MRRWRERATRPATDGWSTSLRSCFSTNGVWLWVLATANICLWPTSSSIPWSPCCWPTSASTSKENPCDVLVRQKLTVDIGVFLPPLSTRQPKISFHHPCNVMSPIWGSISFNGSLLPLMSRRFHKVHFSYGLGYSCATVALILCCICSLVASLNDWNAILYLKL